MSTFFRGPICGTDNCRSRLWRIIDGRRTCQYGHVMEGDVEFNDDEDDINSMGVVTRRLNLTTNASGSFRSSMNSQSQSSQKTSDSMKVYGEEADRLFLKCFQHILKLQCRWLIVNQKFPAVFEEIVKIMWMRLMKSLGEEDGLQPPTELNSGRKNRGEKRGRLGLSLLSGVALLYMAGAHLRLPVFWPDYLRWICSLKLVYFKANLNLAPSYRRQLPNYYLQLLEGGKTPTGVQFYHRLANICGRVDIYSNARAFVTVEPLLLKLLLTSRLPPHMFFYALELIRATETVNSSFEFQIPKHLRSRLTKFYEHPEPKAAAYLILAVRFKLLQRDIFLIRYCTVWLRFAKPGTLEDLITDTSYGLSSEKSWDQKATEDYLQWMETHFLPASTRIEHESQSIDQRIANKKLHAMFPVTGESLGASRSDSSADFSYINQVQDAYLSICDGIQHLPCDQDLSSEDLQTLASHVEARLLTWIANTLAVTEPQLVSCVDHLQAHITAQKSA
ncbi:LAME_0C03532g1_1 [Lachancea meyersii CBS 8951]|uniref:LAME_0C03532g1_1 n=1 Tax=Lachancea meyersii CBS 8951 TaxID=1266667 RepID=A0A1G4J082_9SACH|nr:LAME_0C03532g1_1 [Lachancea meyersii CBS 8951]